MSETLAERCRRSFSPKHWHAGILFYNLGAVKITASDAFGLQATVKGQTSRRDHVSLDWSLAREDASLIVSCTCPRYRHGDLCEHVAATILEADRQNLTARAPGRGTLDVIDEEESEWEFDDDVQNDLRRAIDAWKKRREVAPS